MNHNNSSLNDMIENAMKDPRFAGILSALREKTESGELDVASALSEVENISPSNDGEVKGQSDGASGTHGIDFKKHRQLISALRPYLSDGKKDAVDNILKIGDMSSAFEAVMKLKDK